MRSKQRAERRRGRTRRGKATDDDRPRGFDPVRMRRLWRDIDQARDSLGLGARDGEAAPWGVGDLVAGAVDLAAATARRVAACPAVQTGTALLERLPIVGGVLASVLPAVTVEEPDRRDR